MSAPKRFFIAVFAAVVFMGWFVVQHEGATLARARRQMEEHARVVAPSVWSYDDQSHKPYLELAARSSHYQSIKVLLPDGQEFIVAPGRTPSSMDEFLCDLGLINHTLLVAEIEYSDRIIGKVEAIWHNEAIYRYLAVMAFLCLALVVVWMQFRLLAAKQSLSAQVRSRTRELVEANEELSRLATAIEQAAEDVIITDEGGTIQYVNPAFEKLTGYTQEEVVGRNPRFLQGGEHDVAFYQNMWRTITHGEPWSGRFVNRKKSGTIILQDANTSPIKDKGGKIIGFVSVRRDVTDHVQMERQMFQAQKMEAIGTLAGGIAHDINNILMAIMGYTELVIMELDENPTAKKNLGNVLNAGERVRDLVEQILTFSRQTRQESLPVNVKAIAADVLRLMRASLPSTIEINEQFNTDASVLADPTQLHQVLMNLCTNAEHAMRENGGTLSISLEREDITDTANAEQLGIAPGVYVRLTVEDTGYGIDPDIQSKILEPFFTTKEPGEGTGLGLSVVHGIVENYGGTLKLNSEPGKGSTFYVYLPVTEREELEGESFSAELPVGNERVLFVDDEVLQGSLAEEGLGRLGYKVTAVSSSRTALALFTKAPDGFDLVITDMTMPEMTGDNLAKKMLEVRPDTPILMCTGFSEKIDEKRAAAIGIRGFVRKPIVVTGLGRKIREVMDAPA